MTSELVDGLTRYLHDEFGKPFEVSGVVGVSAGARRRNVLLDATCAGETLQLVATIVPAVVQQIPVGSEAAVRELARSHGVPVPRVRGVCPESSYLGAPFMISERIAGETVPRKVLRLVQAQGIDDLVAGQLGAAMARLHGIDPVMAPPELPGDPQDEPAVVLLEQMRQGVAAFLSGRPVFERTLSWLTERMPGPPIRRCLVHTDIRNGNLIIDETGLRAVLDWEGTTRFGDPMRDVGWAALRMWRFGVDEREFGGFAGRELFVRAYEEAGGSFDVERFQWWKVLGTLWWGVGLAAQAATYLDGSVRDIVMAASGRRIPEIEWDLLMLTKPEGR
ncbi:MAG: phosphotransferase family protein [Mycobacterium sp.]